MKESEEDKDWNYIKNSAPWDDDDLRLLFDLYRNGLIDKEMIDKRRREDAASHAVANQSPSLGSGHSEN